MTHWNEQQLAEYNAKRQSWLGVMGEDTVAEPPHKADEGPESALAGKITKHGRNHGWIGQ